MKKLIKNPFFVMATSMILVYSLALSTTILTKDSYWDTVIMAVGLILAAGIMTYAISLFLRMLK